MSAGRRPTGRDGFIAHQAEVLDRYFALAPRENAARRRFERLALDTYDRIAGKGPVESPFYPYPSAFNFADYDRGAGDLVPAAIRGRWEAWKRDYAALLARNPVLELRDALHDMGESHDASSWPYGMEEEIEDWVAGGDRLSIPFEDRNRVATPAFYGRLRELRALIDGWVHYEERERRVVWSRGADWLKVRAERDGAWERHMAAVHGEAWPRLRETELRRRRETRERTMSQCREILLRHDMEAGGPKP